MEQLISKHFGIDLNNFVYSHTSHNSPEKKVLVHFVPRSVFSPDKIDDFIDSLKSNPSFTHLPSRSDIFVHENGGRIFKYQHLYKKGETSLVAEVYNEDSPELYKQLLSFKKAKSKPALKAPARKPDRVNFFARDSAGRFGARRRMKRQQKP
ncbi:hypothetical protein HUU53_00055 [Candidatus Micrarchaeota archaeon]|nr:hypothetical protein [Candidatus Micrarchaeota archaeon]